MSIFTDMKSWSILKLKFKLIGSKRKQVIFSDKKLSNFLLNFNNYYSKMPSQFGAEFSADWPVKQPEYSEFGKKLLKKCYDIEKPSDTNLNEILENSRNFKIPFPIETCRIKAQPKQRLTAIEKQINSAYPVIHERVLWLYLRFLEHKKKYGNAIEKTVYSDMDLKGFIQRLLSKRCVSFFGPNDKFLLINNHTGKSGFVPIGTEKEKFPLILANCLSYDEIKLSALLSVSSHSEYINAGERENCGYVLTDKSSIETSGIVIGVIGARLSRRDLMEFQDIVISKTQNISKNGYGPKNFPSSTENDESSKKLDYRKIWNEFYEEKDFLFSAVTKDDKRFGASKNVEDIFDNVIMKKRYTISFDTLLLESESRAAAANKSAYIHLVGFGLGVWRCAPQQDEIYMETFESRLKYLLPKLKHISHVHFSWFRLDSCGDLKHGAFYQSKDHPNGGIKILISKRNPADKLDKPELENCLLVVSYAWDGNALPGNEFWMKMLKSTGDSSTACSTLITELHNPHINKTKVSGENLHIASERANGVVHIADYVKILKI